MRDMQYVDPTIANSLQQLVDAKDDEIDGMFLSFSATVSAFGKTETVTLGADVGHTAEDPVAIQVARILPAAPQVLLVGPRQCPARQVFARLLRDAQTLISVFDFQN